MSQAKPCRFVNIFSLADANCSSASCREQLPNHPGLREVATKCPLQERDVAFSGKKSQWSSAGTTGVSREIN